MPRLLRMAARTAVVAGTASAVSGRVQHRQADRWAAQEAPPPTAQPQPVPEQRSVPSTTDTLEQLRTLGELKAQGVLTEDEFAREKAKILGG